VFLDYAPTLWVAHLNRALAAGLELGALEDSVWRLCDPKSYICRSWLEVSGIASLDLDGYNDETWASLKQNALQRQQEKRMEPCSSAHILVSLMA
jgi:hypothetical protein